MPWGRFDDKFHRNEKVRELRKRKSVGREALGVWTFWLSWCLDDPAYNGLIPACELPAIDERGARELVDVGLWEKVGEDYQIHDFFEYAQDPDRIEAKRKADRDRKASRTKVARESHATPTRPPRDLAPESHAGSCPPDPVPDPKEEDSSAAVGDAIEQDRVAAVSGRKWLTEILQRDDYVHSGKWAESLAIIARKPTEERTTVAAMLQQALANNTSRRILTPKHIVDYWATYAAGERPGKPPAGGSSPAGGAPYHAEWTP